MEDILPACLSFPSHCGSMQGCLAHLVQGLHLFSHGQWAEGQKETDLSNGLHVCLIIQQLGYLSGSRSQGPGGSCLRQKLLPHVREPQRKSELSELPAGRKCHYAAASTKCDTPLSALLGQSRSPTTPESITRSTGMLLHSADRPRASTTSANPRSAATCSGVRPPAAADLKAKHLEL